MPGIRSGGALNGPNTGQHAAALQVQDGDAVHGRRLGGQVLDHEELPVVGREGLRLEVPAQVVRPRLRGSGRVGHDDRGPRTRQRDLRVPAVGQADPSARPRRRSPRRPERRASRPAGRRTRARRPKPSTVSSSVEPAEGVAESSHEPPRLATVPGRSNSTDPLGTWTTSGPAWVPRSRVSRGTGLLSGTVVRRALRARGDPRGPPRTAPRSASSRMVCDLPFGARSRAGHVLSFVRLRNNYFSGARKVPGNPPSHPTVCSVHAGNAGNEEGSHAQTTVDRRRDARRGDARGGLRPRGRTAARTSTSIGPTTCPARRRGSRGTCPSLEPSRILIERGPFYVFVVPRADGGDRGPADPGRCRPGRHRFDRARPRIDLRTPRVVRRPRARRPLVRALASATTRARSPASASH